MKNREVITVKWESQIIVNDYGEKVMFGQIYPIKTQNSEKNFPCGTLLDFDV